MLENPEKEYGYEEIYLLHNKCIAESRDNCDPSVMFGGRKFRVPVIPANMKAVIDDRLAVWMAKNNYFYIMHRFNGTRSFINLFEAALNSNPDIVSSISVGVKEEDRQLIGTIKKYHRHPDYITIDIAHGHCLAMKEMIAFIREELPNTFIIAGNICTA
ncbi:MAG: IMP dehydrogenase, partial [archaeon]